MPDCPYFEYIISMQGEKMQRGNQDNKRRGIYNENFIITIEGWEKTKNKY